MLNDDQIQQQLQADLQVAFDAACKQIPHDAIVGFGILSNDTGTMFLPVIASLQDQAESTSRDDFLFDPCNWLQNVSRDIIERYVQLFNTLYEECDDEESDDHWHEEFRSRVYQILVRSLEHLKRNRYFDFLAQEPFLIVWVVDSVLPNVRGRAWSKRLNSPQMHRKFIAWLDRIYGA